MNLLTLGSGQLARMLALAAVPLGARLLAVDVRRNRVVDPISDHEPGLTIAQAFDQAHCITIEFEHIPRQLLEQAGSKLQPSMKCVLTGGDRLQEKALLDQLEIATSPWRRVHNRAELISAAEELGFPLVLKSRRGGYDGYGQWRVQNAAALGEVVEDIHKSSGGAFDLIAEAFVPFDGELSLVGVRNRQGNFAFYPLAENHHANGQLRLTFAPAPACPRMLEELARRAFARIAEELEFVGVMAVEFFRLGDDLWVNEIAPRVHNSGHWTLNGSVTSQFENQIRAVLDLPLGSTASLGVSAMINIIGHEPVLADVLTLPGCHYHWYGKELREKRKLGHINVQAADAMGLASLLNQLAHLLPASHYPFLLQVSTLVQERSSLVKRKGSPRR
jgi:5-(carboxyamino)imidazole ribonucleotide synthase